MAHTWLEQRQPVAAWQPSSFPQAEPRVLECLENSPAGTQPKEHKGPSQGGGKGPGSKLGEWKGSLSES